MMGFAEPWRNEPSVLAPASLWGGRAPSVLKAPLARGVASWRGGAHIPAGLRRRGGCCVRGSLHRRPQRHTGKAYSTGMTTRNVCVAWLTFIASENVAMHAIARKLI